MVASRGGGRFASSQCARLCVSGTPSGAQSGPRFVRGLFPSPLRTAGPSDRPALHPLLPRPAPHAQVLSRWLAAGIAAPWDGRFGAVGAGSNDFFGLPAEGPVYCGVGGMDAIARGQLAAAQELHPGVTVRPGTRVSGVSRAPAGAWVLEGTGGRAALHDTPESEAAPARPGELGTFDAVVVTDASASFDGWHRASAGLPESLTRVVRPRVRVCLMTAIVAFAAPVAVPLDGITFNGDAALWFAARCGSKPGLAPGPPAPAVECWTLVCTPAWAAAEIGRVPMQDAATGAFIPQSPEYLLSPDGPARTMLEAFRRAVAAHFGAALPEVAYLDAQRWGSALPAPAGVGGRDAHGAGPGTVEVSGVRYDSTAAGLPLVPRAEAPDAADFVADDGARLYYAGDFVSPRAPGLEAAALSGVHAARHLCAQLVPEV